MTTVIIDTRTNEARRLVEYLKTVKYVKVLENNQDMAENYNPVFIQKIKEREKQPTVKTDLENLWK